MANEGAPEIIGIEQDHLAPILERVRTRLLEKGVRQISSDRVSGVEVYEGMGNRYVTPLYLDEITEQQSPEQADQMVADMVLSVEQGLLQRRTEIEE